MRSLHDLDDTLQALKPIQTLEKCLNSGRIPHAIFLYGPSLEALEQVAHSFGKRLLGTEEKGEESLKDSDYFSLRPTNKMRQIDADSVRETLKKLHQTTSHSHKLAILYEADRLNAYAANALLKTLEEPPAKTTLLLLSTRPHEVLPTVLSRCFQFRILAEVPCLDHPQWAAWLESLEAWLKPLIEETNFNKAFFAEALMGAYGLVYRFESILEGLLKPDEKPRHNLREDEAALSALKAEEKIALESARLKSIRQELLKSIEKALRAIALPYILPANYSPINHSPIGHSPIHHSQANYSPIHHSPVIHSPIHHSQATCHHTILSLCQMIQAFEEATQLLEVNLHVGTALESFFLQTLKLWIRNKA